LKFQAQRTLDGAPGGNGDGFINPGETVGLSVTLRNVGLNQASGVNATLTASDQYVTVTDAAAAFGNISGRGAAKEALDPFVIQVSSGCPTPRAVPLTLNITGTGCGPWTAGFTIMIYTSSQVSGRVLTATGNNPVSGAAIAYAGPITGQATAGADGAYAFTAVDGTYAVTAKAAGSWTASPWR